jgi:hypothetical protein
MQFSRRSADGQTCLISDNLETKDCDQFEPIPTGGWSAKLIE